MGILIQFCVALLFFSGIAGFLDCRSIRAAENEDAKPNFIIVFCDNLGYGDVEPFGSKLHRTPNLNRMASEGRKFTHFCVTAGVCTPSRASLMTGCYAQRVGMHFNERDGWVLRPLSRYGLNPGEFTIAEVLKQQGYATAIIGKWHLGDHPTFLPTRQGFDWFFGVPYSDDMTARTWKDGSVWPPLPLMENETVVEAPCDRNGLTKRYTEKAKEWISQHQDEPFFLYFPQAMPGSTKTPFASPEFKGKSKNGPWGDAIEELDWSLGALLDHLRDLEIAENTFVIWTSDNGAPIHTDLTDLSRGSNLPLHGRGYTTAEGAFRVPTIVWQPGKVPANTECGELVTTMDLLPTFAALAGGQPPQDRTIDGYDISDLLFDEPGAESPYEAFFYYDQRQLQAVRSGPWKLFLPIKPIGRHPHFGKQQSPESLLFNVVDDVASEHNLARQQPEIVARLTQLAEQARADLGDLDYRGSGQRAVGQLPADVAPQPLLMQQSAIEVIESERGGRHWIDAETAPPKSPEDSLDAMRIEEGYEIQLFASEPLVMDPVAIAFDRQGRMFVSEYSDYPIGPANEDDPPLSRIVLLEDTDQNGQADQRTIFADKLDFAHSLMPYKSGLLVGAKTRVLYLEDSDGDGRADIRQTLFEGFTPAHPQMQIGNPRWGLDNWVYLNYGPGSVSASSDPEVVRKLPRKEFRFRPESLEFEAGSGLGQFGNTIDRWGRRFYCTNRNPIMTTHLMPEVLERNPFYLAGKAYYDVGLSGGDSRVYPLVKMKSNWLSHAGTHTSACGTTAYVGDLGDDGFQSSVFVCEPIGHLVTRSVIRTDGLRLVAERAQPAEDFIASTDTWFRPASLSTGPDGALYLADMYRLWVEHPKFLPPEIAARLDWRAGEDRGRIYRIVPTGSRPSRFQPPATQGDLVRLLQDPNGWRQELAQRLLVESRDVPASELRKLLEYPRATTRLRALWTLEGTQQLDLSDVLQATKDTDERVRISAVRLAGRRIEEPNVLQSICALGVDESVRVRFEVALALGLSEDPLATRTLIGLAVQDGSEPLFAQGLLTSTRNRSAVMLTALVEDRDFLSNVDANPKPLVQSLAEIAGARGDLVDLQELFACLSESSKEDWWRFSLVSGLGNGLPRYRGALGKLSLERLVREPPDQLTGATQILNEIFADSRSIASDVTQRSEARIAAIDLLGQDETNETIEVLRQHLSQDHPVEVQQASLAALRRMKHAQVAEVILERFNELGPSLRSSALETLLRRTTSLRLLLDAIAAGTIRGSALSIDQRLRLLKHPNDAIRIQASALFGAAVSTNRLGVAKEYEVALSMAGNKTRGQVVFQRVCANCHRFEGKGHEVGPDLSDVRNRSKPALLYDMLDPNSKVEPRFTAYSALTVDDRIITGLVVEESSTSITLQMAEGKQLTLPRDEIDQLKSSGVSLMPEGIEKEISKEQMADLLAYLKD